MADGIVFLVDGAKRKRFGESRVELEVSLVATIIFS